MDRLQVDRARRLRVHCLQALKCISISKLDSTCIRVLSLQKDRGIAQRRLPGRLTFIACPQNSAEKSTLLFSEADDNGLETSMALAAVDRAVGALLSRHAGPCKRWNVWMDCPDLRLP
ncbi:unnamed protein product [Protopolystoma xenopodis]|uniref:Uncharacterized protein n=1 Tax=Protopolystoma xenopodis TaxID=117903 RepID=A0A448XKK7_9PLAT|nr:unnamed protein product [Protopolystoma xenopodis]